VAVTATPSVAVLIVTRNRRSDVLDTLNALTRLDYPPDRLEVLVFDNGSTDGTSAAVDAWTGTTRRLFRRVECMRADENLGPAAARNRLALKASPASDVLFLLDDDAAPAPDFLTRALAALGGDASVGVVGGRIVAWDAPARDLAGAGFVDWRLGRFREVPATGTLDCDFVISCAMLVRPEAFRAAGGFDEDYFVYHEDVDFCVRVGRRGFRVRWAPEAVARHKVPAGKTRTPERLYYLTRNKLLFLRKHLPPRRHPMAWLAAGLGLIPRLVLESLRINRGLAVSELRAILRAGRHGFGGRGGRWPP
jgi:GT2 family glycosyltransferase